MIAVTLENLGQKLKAKRGNIGLRETAKDIGISTSTLSRIERGKLPEVINFKKICDWLEVDPGEVLKIEESTSRRSLPELTKEDYAYIYECIDRTIQLAKLR